ncbi:hypothetical protein OK016_01290 [Vibrio chagasii]|nr:hypothetical protein [Vibrio chagasii]
MKAAAANLTPVTPELGGKLQPSSHQISMSQMRLNVSLFAKSLNAGQICVAPDYILLPRERKSMHLSPLTSAYSRSFIKQELRAKT